MQEYPTQRFKEGAVGVKPIEVVQLTGGHPAQCPVLGRDRLAVGDARRPHAQSTIAGDGHLTDELLRHDDHAEFLDALADESLVLGLARVQLAARKLPTARQFGRCRPLRGEHPSITIQDRRPDDTGGSHPGHPARLWPGSSEEEQAMPQLLSDDQVRTALVQLDGWEGDTTAIRRTAVLPSFEAAIEVVRQVGGAAEELDHHPDIDIRWRTLHFACSTHSDNGVTGKDTDLAARIDAIVAAVGTGG